MAPAKVPVVLSIAGFDPSAGAGVAADLKTAAAFGCYGVAAITALTVQNTQGVQRTEVVRPELLRDTLTALADDNPLAAIKIGMLGSAEIAEVVARFLQLQQRVPVVLDPIIRSSSGAVLLEAQGVKVLRKKVIPLATVVTPNADEAAALAGAKVRLLEDVKLAAEKLQRLGAKNVVITGGHLEGNTDLLLNEAGQFFEFTGEKVRSDSTHGTGCAFSTAIACGLANGKKLPDAVRDAKEYVRQAIENAYPVGKGTGPMNHLFRLR